MIVLLLSRLENVLGLSRQRTSFMNPYRTNNTVRRQTGICELKFTCGFMINLVLSSDRRSICVHFLLKSTRLQCPLNYSVDGRQRYQAKRYIFITLISNMHFVKLVENFIRVYHDSVAIILVPVRETGNVIRRMPKESLRSQKHCALSSLGLHAFAVEERWLEQCLDDQELWCGTLDKIVLISEDENV